MIVRNEAKVIARCLQSVLSVIDYWVICDTGSTDATRSIISKTLKKVPGELHEHSWVNFGFNRTTAFRLAEGKADYVLFIDADMILNVHEAFKSRLNADAYLLRYNGALDYWQTMLVSAAHRWEYVGPTHEYVHAATAAAPHKLDSISLTHFADGGTRSDKFVRDIRLLTEALEKEPGNTRYLFYLAQSYNHIGEHSQAIRYYRERAAAGGWEEESWYALYQVGVMLEESQAPREQIFAAYVEAFENRPQRAEPLFRLVRWLRIQERYAEGLLYAEKALTVAYPTDILFVEKPVYEYNLLFEYAICAHYAGNAEEAVHANYRVIGHPSTPRFIAQQAVRNTGFSLAKLVDEKKSASSQKIRVAGFSFDIDQRCGSGLSLKYLMAYLAGNEWPCTTGPDVRDEDALRQWSPELMVSQQWAILEAFDIAAALKIPLVQYVHGPGQYERTLLENKGASFCIFCSAAQYTAVKNQYPDMEGIVLHPIVLPAARKRKRKGSYITLVGTTAEKGLHIFLDLARKMPREKFLLVGDRESKRKLPANVTTLPATENMNKVYEDTQLLLVPSVDESYGRVIVEAAMLGVVSVVTDCRGIREATNFEHAVYIRDREDVSEWVSAIRNVLASPKEHSEKPAKLLASMYPELELEYVKIKLAEWANRNQINRL